MEALIASYGDASSDTDTEADTSPPLNPPSTTKYATKTQEKTVVLPPPPVSLLTSPNSYTTDAYPIVPNPNRVRNFPHVEGNYALHVYIPVQIPRDMKKETALFLKKVSSLCPATLHIVDMDILLDGLCGDDGKLEQVLLGREFHISLGRTVPIRVHQIDSLVSMLRQRLFSCKRYWIDFNKWEVFVNDDRTRTFLSMEVVTGGLAEINKQIQYVDEVYRLHNLPEFYKNPRPHISAAWALGDISDSLRTILEEQLKRSSIRGSVQNRIFTCKFNGIECKAGNKLYTICKIPD